MENAAQTVKRSFKTVTPNFGAMGFMVALAISQFFYYINFRGEGFDREVALAYIIIPPVLLGYYVADHLLFKKMLALDQLRLFPTIMAGFIGFVTTWAVVVMVYGYGMGMEFGAVPVTAVWGAVITQVLFVACSEELAFRYVIPTYLAEKWPRTHAKLIAAVLSSAAFAMFHLAAYGGNHFSLMLAFIIGMLWMGAYNIPFRGGKLGLGFTIGSHAAYNLTLIGVLSGGISLISGGL
jgi:membrane protease YdiL (CAAX protease family)